MSLYKPFKECPKCKGKGYIVFRNNKRDIISEILLYERKTCSICHGKGFVRDG